MFKNYYSKCHTPVEKTEKMTYVHCDHRKSAQIKITHYVSPHEFWFKYLDGIDNEKDHAIQEKIQRLSDIGKKYQNHTPSIGEIVVVQCCFGDEYKYIRARCDYEFKYSNASEFILWAMDDGFPIRSSSKWIAKLTSEDLRNINTSVFKATLNVVVPATLKFDFLEEKSVLHKTSAWSEKAINEFEKVLSADSLIFHYDCHAAEQHIYGSLEVNTFTGKSFFMSKVLKDLEEAVDATDFVKEYQKLVHKDYWFQVQQNYKIRENLKCSIHPADIKALSPKSIPDINTVDKINDWDKRNQRLLRTMDAESDSLAEKIQERSLKEIPLNKRYKFCTKLDAVQPSTSKTTPSESDHLSTDSSPSKTEFLRMATASPDIQSHRITVSKAHFKKAIQNERFSTRNQDRVLMHCRDGVLIHPISSITEANFNDEIHDRLKRMTINQVYRTQAVGWPHLMRRHSLIVINATETGKTWTYLPAVCSLLLEAHNDEKIVVCEGPVMIILCLDSSVKKVQKNCKSLLETSGTCVAFTQFDTESIQYDLLNGIDILITTVPCLLRLMKNSIGLVSKKRITTVVFDEIDTMSDRYGEKNIKTIFTTLCDSAEVQTIVTSKTWHNTLKKFWVKDDMLLCIGAYIEAALYSNTDIIVQSTNERKHYQDFLTYFKQRNYFDEQTVIVCSESREVFKIKDILQSEGISNVTYCHDKTNTEEIDSINALNGNPDELGILVCTDDSLGDLLIRNAQHIIHFSLPNTWTTFTKRFLVSFDYYHNLIGDKLSAGRPTSVVFVDEHSCDSLPRLVEFMRTRCLAEVPNNILELAEAKRFEREERLKIKKIFCENLLLLGVCYNQHACPSRHILTNIDRSDEFIPKTGRIKFNILSIRSPAHFSVRLLEHYSSERNEWQKVPHVDDYFSFQRTFGKHFSDETNHHIHHPIQMGDLCVMDVSQDGSGQFERCEIIGIDRKNLTINFFDDETKIVLCTNSPLR